MSSIEYEFHVAPFQAERVRFLRRAKGLGINQTAVNPAWECKSYPKNLIYFKTGDVTQQERLRPRPRWPKFRLGEWRP